MEENLDSSFRTAAENCNRCYNEFKDGKDARNSSLVYAHSALKEIMDSYDKTNKNWKLANELLKDCNNCDFRDPKIKNNLEGYE